MHSLSEILAKESKKIQWDSKWSEEELAAVEGMTPMQEVCYWQNQKQGNLNTIDGIECSKCLNRGFMNIVNVLPNGAEVTAYQECECTVARKAYKTAKESGMGDLLSYRLRDFKATEEFQVYMKDKAKKYILEADKEWFLALGQSGSGKTMICASICNQRMTKYDSERDRFQEVKYMIWNEFVDKIKRMNYDLDRDVYFNEFSKSEILYVDDFLKGKYTETDLNYAFQLINYRYNNNLPTIISSEMFLDELRAIDEAIAGRMKQKAGSYLVQIRRDSKRNYRFKDEEMI